MSGKKSTSSPRKNSPQDKLKLPDRKTSPIRLQDAPPAGAPIPEKKTSSGGSLEEVSRAYRLNRQAVEDLVTADESNSPPVPRAELRRYQSGPKVKMADWVKALILKWWAGGMVCYFFIWGLSTFPMNPWDQILVLGIALGLVTNLIVNNIFRFIAHQEGAYDRWMMFPGKKFLFLPLDILYALVLVFCTELTYGAVNRLFRGAEASSPALGVEPLLFGLILLLWDLLFLGMKRLGKNILQDARKQ